MFSIVKTSLWLRVNLAVLTPSTRLSGKKAVAGGTRGARRGDGRIGLDKSGTV